MLGLFERKLTFVPPPCFCDEIERHVAEAIAMRDEMAKWGTPLEEWVKLQQMPVLQAKAKPKPVVQDTWRVEYEKLFDQSIHVSSATKMHGPYRSEPPALGLYRSGDGLTQPPVVIHDGSPGSMTLLPGERGEVGDILVRGNGRYQVTSKIYGGSGDRALVVKLRD